MLRSMRFCLRIIGIKLLTLLSIFGFSQDNGRTVIANYEFYRKPETSPFIIQYNSTLIVGDSSSLYEIDLKNPLDSTRTITNNQGSYTLLNEKTNAFFYKEVYKNKLISSERVLLRKFTVEDRLDLFHWVVTNTQKTILGYQCQQAKTSFRGRNYTAYFAPSIPISNGPWKFQGLPGLILEVQTDDESFRMTAKLIEIKNAKWSIPNPYKEAKSISRSEYEGIYIKKYKELEGYRGADDETMKMPKGLLEIIVKD